MRILHLYSDWKWTGPAEPVIQMCKALEERGHDVTFACRATPPEHADADESVQMKAAEYGIHFTTEFGLNRYWGFRDSIYDLVHLPAYIRRRNIDVIHTHLSHDHAFGCYAKKMCLSRRPVLVKSMHNREALPQKFWNNRLLKGLRGKNGLLVFSEGFRRRYAERFSISPDRIGVCPMPLDLVRFRPDRPFVSQRKAFNIPAGSPVIGIVARFQKYRRMDVFLEAARRVVDEFPDVRFVVIGRSGQMRDTVITPMKDLGLEKNVITPGYLTDHYVDMMMTLDIFTLMIPGFDGTARALREAMALGKPCVASDIGMLPDIVKHGERGLIFTFPDAGDLAACWLDLLRNPRRAKMMGDTGAAYAKDAFRLDAVGPALETFYQSLGAGQA
ncbi:MAG: glycosyltransferase family 4 protein [Lentisphaeria bacterium]|nr:glycosyltransferase family 4 protein [Lentisphaeria bacterium]